MVRPSGWASLNKHTPPPVLINTGGEGQHATDRATLTVEALEQALRLNDDRAVAYAKLLVTQGGQGGHPGEKLLTLQVGQQLREWRPPTRAGKLRLRDFDLVERMVERARAVAAQPDPEGGALHQELNGRAMRDWLYAQRTEDSEHGGIPHALAQLAPAPGQNTGTLMTALLTVLAKPLFIKLPRMLWDWRWTWRCVRSGKYGWARKWLNITKPYGSFTDRMSELLEAQATALRSSDASDAAARQNPLFELEKFLMRALLADLYRARAGRFLGPWKRRRRTRRVVLLELPPADSGHARNVERFLQAYRSAYRERGSSSLFVVGAGLPQGYADRPEQGWDRQAEDGLAVAAQHLRQDAGAPGDAGDPWLLVPTIPEKYFAGGGIAGGGLPVVPVRSHVHPWGPGGEGGVELVAVAVTLALVAQWLVGGGEGRNVDCLDGATVAANVTPETLPGVDLPQNGLRRQKPEDEYVAVRRAIDKLNEKALAAEAAAKTDEKIIVRRVVHLGPPISSDDSKAGFNGALAELRGVWMAQARVNHEAEQDTDRVRLVVDVRDAGKDFENAAKVAENVAAEAEKSKGYQDSRTITGVVGFAESRQQTLRAAQEFDRHRIPVVGTTATAVAMHTDGGYYRPLAPNNDREAKTEAAFAGSGSVIEKADDPAENSGKCDTALQAVVVKDPDDLYSDELGDKFIEHFEGRTHTLKFPSTTISAGEAADQICRRKKDERRTVVYWASRVERFRAFLNSYSNTNCAYQNLTVIGGNELTNAAMRAEDDYAQNWLRLYHTVHVLPVGHRERNGEAERFTKTYAYYAGKEDLWLNDGRAPLAFDALRLIGLAADEANDSNTGEVSASAVKSELDDEIELEGASGAIRYPEDNIYSKPPLDKGLVIVRHTEDGPRPALICGSFSLNREPIKEWGPNNSDCPTD
ncbi:hypothetical protein [Streptomyces sp. 2A115]|uniref:hypothetical protein n=1 Tax=Streptomyces sp. 2A115 TaxID=3457439 RepID=UPI003FD581B6